MHRYSAGLLPLNHTRFILLLLVLTIELVFGAAITEAEEGPAGRAYRGQAIFSQRCVQCHGVEGKGDGPMGKQAPVEIADFTEPQYIESRSPQEMYDIIFQGRLENLMPPWGDSLSEQDIWDTVAYIWSLSSSPKAMADADLYYRENCAACHGEDGTGSDYGTPLPSLGDPKWLESSEKELSESIVAARHEDEATPGDASELVSASAASRSFSLGYTILEPVLEGSGVIKVILRNGTTGEIPAKQDVRLFAFEGDAFSQESQAESDAEGIATFGDVPTDPTWVYVAEVSYEDLPYGSGLQQFASGESTLEIPVTMYESGASEDDISITRAHWVLDLLNPGQIGVGELYVIDNASQRVYSGTGDTAAVLEFELPANANNIGVEGAELGSRFIVEGNTLTDTLPMAPGQRQLLFRYTLPIEAGAVAISHAVKYPVAFLNLLVPDTGIDIEAPEWIQGERTPAQNGAFENFTLVDLPAGTLASATLTGITSDMFAAEQPLGEEGQQIIDAEATPGISGQPYLPFVIVLLGAGVLVGATIVVLRRQQRYSLDEAALEEQQRQDLIQAIADLDDQFEEGEISRGDYETQRGYLKSQLVSLMREDNPS